MSLFVHRKADFTFPRKGDYDTVPSLSYPVALVFPSTFTFGTIYVVVPWQPTGIARVASVAGDPSPDAGASFEFAVTHCVEAWSPKWSETAWRWRLYIHGRHYGPVIPDDTPMQRVSIPMTPGGFYVKGPDVSHIINNILYWDDMDAGFYRRFE